MGSPTLWMIVVVLVLLHTACGYRWGVKGAAAGVFLALLLSWLPAAVQWTAHAFNPSKGWDAWLGMTILFSGLLTIFWGLLALVCGTIGAMGRGTGISGASQSPRRHQYLAGGLKARPRKDRTGPHLL